MIGVSIVFIAACILMAGFYAGTETGSYRLNRIRLRLRAEDGDSAAGRLTVVLRSADEFVITTLVGNNLFVFLATYVCTRLYKPHYRAEILATATLFVPIFLFGEVAQKEIFRRAADVLMYRAVPLLRLSVWVLRPVVKLLKGVQGFWTIFLKHSGGGDELELSRRRLNYFFSESAAEGVLSIYQSHMARNIMSLQEVRLDRVMIPIERVATLPLNASFEECRRTIAEQPYRRFPVIDESGRPVGLVNVLDVLAHGDAPFDIRDYIRKPTRLQRDMNVTDALHLLKRSRQPMGFIADAEGHTAGIVTIKDLVECIVGELQEW